MGSGHVAHSVSQYLGARLRVAVEERRDRSLPLTGKERDVSQAAAQRQLPPASRSPASARTDARRLVALRHHASVWVAPAILLIAALFPWPYGYYVLLRLAVFVVSAWIAYEQWRFDDAVSGWVVAFGGVALLYNPFMPVHLTREIWSVLNISTAVLFLTHLRVLRGLIAGRSSERRQIFVRSAQRLKSLPRSFIRRLSLRQSMHGRDITSLSKED